LNTTPSPLLAAQFTTLDDVSASPRKVKQIFLEIPRAATKMVDSKKNPFCDYSPIKEFPVKKSITLNLLDLAAYALLFSLPIVLKSGRS